MGVRNNIQSERNRIYYCTSCESFFTFNNQLFNQLNNVNVMCPYCKASKVIMLSDVLGRLSKQFLKFLRNIDRLRMLIEKIILKLDNIVSVIKSKNELEALLQNTKLVSGLLNLYAELGLINDKLEQMVHDNVNSFIMKLKELISEFEQTDRYFKVSKINELLENFSHDVSKIVPSLRKISEKYLHIVEKVKRFSFLVDIIKGVLVLNDEKMRKILRVEKDTYLLLTDRHIYLINIRKRKINKKIPIGWIYQIYGSKKLFANGITIEGIDGKKIFIKTESNLLSGLENIIYTDSARNIHEIADIDMERKTIRPVTKSLRETISNAKQRVLSELNKSRERILFRISDGIKEEKQKEKKDSHYTLEVDSVTKILLEDLERKYDQGKISLEEYMRFKRSLLGDSYSHTK